MIPRKQYFYLARIVLENRAGLSLATGHPDHGFDSVLVRDANGLPTLPGTALAGVLRQAFTRLNNDKAAEDLFGWQRGNKGEPSRVHVGWGCLLDHSGQAVFGLKLSPDDREALDKDELLGPLLENDHQRQRVRINHRGVAADTGKFDRAVLPAGHRFAVELCLESDQADDPHWKELLGLLASRQIRLGGSTRAGLGRMKLVECHQRCFDLHDADDTSAFRKLGSSPGDTAGLKDDLPKAVTPAELITGTLNLRCDDFFRFGGEAGEPGSPDDERDQKTGKPKKPADLLPKFEPVIDWTSGKARSETGVLLIPGSSVKGALAHRFAFHYNALTGVFADQFDTDQIEDWDKAAHCPGTRALFGFVEGSKKDGGEAARAGCLYIDDARLRINSEELQRLMHVAIDQFTGGARHGMLFEEQLVATEKPIEIKLVLDDKRLEENRKKVFDKEGNPPDRKTILQALGRALEDLTTGMLPLGAASGRGHGFFSGRLEGDLVATLNTTQEQGA